MSANELLFAYQAILEWWKFSLSEMNVGSPEDLKML